MGKRGGYREGAGRKRLIDEKTNLTIMMKAVQQMTNTKTNEEAKIAYLNIISRHERGQMFIAEHIFGKPKDNINIETETPVNINLSALSSATLLEIKELYDKNSTDRIG